MDTSQGLGQLDIEFNAARRELAEIFLMDKMKNQLKDKAADRVKRFVKR